MNVSVPLKMMICLLVLGTTRPVTAQVQVLVDVRCQAGSGDALLVEALDARDVATELDAKIVIEGEECAGWLEVAGERSPLGPVDLGERASVRAAASMISWLLEPGGPLSSSVAIAASRTNLRGALAMSTARMWVTSAAVTSVADMAVSQASASVLGARASSTSLAAGAVVEEAQPLEPPPNEAETWAWPGVSAGGAMTSINGDTAALWDVGVGIVRRKHIGLAVHAVGSATPVTSKYVFVVLRDGQEPERVQPRLSTLFLSAQASYQRPVFASRKTSEAFVALRGGLARVALRDVSFAGPVWVPVGDVSAGVSFRLGSWRVKTGPAYRLVRVVDFIGPEPRALTGPEWRLGVQWATR